MLVLLLGIGQPAVQADAPARSLAGSWRFALDPHDIGQADGWFTTTLPQRVDLPGSLPAQQIGDPPSLDTPWVGGIQDPQWHTRPEYAPYAQPGSFKFPFWLQPDHYYAGAAWYQRNIVIPPRWSDQRIVLHLERPHWETRVWVDGQPHGVQTSLGTPHLHDLGTLPAGRHNLTIRVDNRLVVDVGINSHSVTDHTQGNWNGIIGRIELQATPTVWIEDLQVYPDLPTRSARVQGRIGNATGKAGRSRVRLTASPRPAHRVRHPGSPNTVECEVEWTPAGGTFSTIFPLGPDALLWDEFSPNLYHLTARLLDQGHQVATRFGLREFKADGTRFLLNGRPIFLRGTLECAIFPRTGHPPTDPASWQRILLAARSHGLNSLRFHSWCPPQAAFDAADELGFLYQIECSTWPNQSTTLGDGKPIDAWIYQETEAILRHHGNHPSFVLFASGNEPGGSRHQEFLAAWVNHFKSRDPRRLHTAGSGWPQLPENQFHVTPDPRVHAWGEGLRSRINARPPETRTDYRDYIRARSVPVISHEIGQWCVYPNFDEVRKYTGYLKPRNFEIFRETLARNHLAPLARPFLLASGRLQALCYKEEIESALRTPGMAGFQLLDLHDFPGQGTALVGVLDPFWESKGYISPEAYRRFCNTTVPLARLDRRVFTSRDSLVADLEIAHFGPDPFESATPVWRLVDDHRRTRALGTLPSRQIPIGNGTPLGQIRLPLANLPAPARYQLVVGLRDTSVENDWDVWVYPPEVPLAPPENIRVARTLDGATLEALNQGATLWLQLPPERLRSDSRGRVALGFSPIFWNTAWTQRQPPHTLGLLLDPQHPLFASFPTESHSNWQWWYLVHRAGAILLDQLPPNLEPCIRVIDDWVTARPLALAFEARLGTGKILVTSIDLETDLESNPVARQLRTSLLNYLSSPRFRPRVTVTPEQIRGLVTP